MPAGQLSIGDLLNSHNGQWTPVIALELTGEVEKVYNFRIADHHTYFVGDEDWGFSVWVHNRYTVVQARRDAQAMADGNVGGAQGLLDSLNSNLSAAQSRGYVFQTRRAKAFFDSGALAEVEFATMPHLGSNSPRVDILLKDGLRIENKSWTGWLPPEALANIGNTNVRDMLRRKQIGQLKHLTRRLDDMLATPGNVRVEFDRTIPGEARDMLEKLQAVYGSRLTFDLIAR